MRNTLRRNDHHNGQISSSEIAEELERTQQRIEKTLNQITYKMNPKSIGSTLGAYLVESLDHFEIQDVRHLASRAADRTGQVLKEHPVPVFFGCLAIASCLLGRERRTMQREEEEHGRIRAAVDSAAASATTAASRLSASAAREAEALARTARSTRRAVSERAGEGVEKFDEFAHRASDKITEAAHKAADVARDSSARLRSAASETAENHPLGMALGALAVGFLTALVVPRSREEE